MMKMGKWQGSMGLAYALMAALLGMGCKVVTRAEAKERQGAVSLFNGKDLSGWAGAPGLWTVEEGAITGTTTSLNPIKNNTFLIYTNAAVDNFELRLKYRVFNGNSGIQYRSQVLDAEKAIVGGYQADIEAGKTYSGILYEERGRGILALRGQRTVINEAAGQTKVNVIGELGKGPDLQAFVRQDDWNEYLIVANGNHLMHFINGKLMVDVVDDQASKAAKSGVLALQIHVGPPMKVQFKDLVLKKLP
ncbi:MAG: DUF1080 domain-containing protein [Verrucomicrobiota bacterium]